MTQESTMIRALIFDFDGLILETEGPDYQAWQRIYQEYGLELPLATWLQVVGSGFSEEVYDPYLDLEQRLKRPINREAIRAKHSDYEAAITSELLPMPGVREIIADAQKLGFKLAIASSSDRAWVVGHLERLGLAQHFDVIKTAEDVRHIKPAPDLFLAVLDALDLRSAEAIVLEDSANGVKAAKRAGIFVVAVPNELTRHIDLSHADLQLSSLAEMPLKEILPKAQQGLMPDT